MGWVKQAAREGPAPMEVALVRVSSIVVEARAMEVMAASVAREAPGGPGALGEPEAL